jgi:hypothetical protein
MDAVDRFGRTPLMDALLCCHAIWLCMLSLSADIRQSHSFEQKLEHQGISQLLGCASDNRTYVDIAGHIASCGTLYQDLPQMIANCEFARVHLCGAVVVGLHVHSTYCAGFIDLGCGTSPCVHSTQHVKSIE